MVQASCLGGSVYEVPEARDFFISYTGVDETWARWIAVELERAGYTTVSQALDFRPGNDFLHAMHQAIEAAMRTIAVLSPAYFGSEHGEAEWRAALSQDPSGAARRLIPVRVQPCDPPGLLSTRKYIDLVGLDEDVARGQLLAGVGDSVEHPTAARYPGRAAGGDGRVDRSDFPGPTRMQSHVPDTPRSVASRLPRILDFVAPPEATRRRIRDAMVNCRPEGAVVITGHSGYGKTGLARWACQEAEEGRLFDRVIVVEYRDDWPLAARGQQAVYEFREQLGGMSHTTGDVAIDELLGVGTTLLVLDDVRSEVDLRPFAEIRDTCTLLITTVDSKIATILRSGKRSVTLFDLNSADEKPWVECWANDILTQGLPPGSAVGDLVRYCGSWPLLVARLNQHVRSDIEGRTGITAVNDAFRRVESRLHNAGPEHFEVKGDTDRQYSVSASVRFTLWSVERLIPGSLRPVDRVQRLAALPADVDVPIDILGVLWETEDDEEARDLAGRLAQLHVVQIRYSMGRLGENDRICLLDSDREYLRHKYDDVVRAAHGRLVDMMEDGQHEASPFCEYRSHYLVWHLIGARAWDRLATALTSPAYMVDSALGRGMIAIENDLMVTLSATRNVPEFASVRQFLEPLLKHFRQSVDILQKCTSPESFGPTLATRLRSVPALRAYADALNQYGGTHLLDVDGPAHDLADNRLARRLPRRTSTIKAMMWMRDPDRMGVAYADGAARVWEPSNQWRLREQRQPDVKRIVLASWAQGHRGALAVGYSDNSIQVWPIPAGRQPPPLPAENLTALAWSGHGVLAYAGSGGTVAFWPGLDAATSVATGQRPITALAWSDDGVLAVGRADGSVWTIDSGRSAQVLHEHPGGAAALRWSATGTVACGGWEGTTRVVDRDGVMAPLQPARSDRRGCAVLAWSTDGDCLAVGGLDGAVSVWSPSECRTVLQARARAVRAMAWSPTEQILAVAHDDGVVRFWHGSPAPHISPIVEAGYDVVDIAWSGRGDVLGVALSDGSITTWNPFDAPADLPMVIRTDGPTTASASPDGTIIATAEQAGSVALWNVAGRTDRRLDSRAAWKPVLAWAPASRQGHDALLVNGGPDGKVDEWRISESPAVVEKYRHRTWVSGLCWSSRGDLATLSRDWVVAIHRAQGSTVEIIAHEGGTTAFRWSPDGSRFATAGNDWQLKIWEQWNADGAADPSGPTGWRVIAQSQVHRGGITTMRWSPDGEEVATSGWDRYVHRWLVRPGGGQHPRTHRPAKRNGSPHFGLSLVKSWRTHAAAVTSLAWRANAASLAGVDQRGRLHVLHIDDAMLVELKGSHEGHVTGMHWLEESDRILTVGVDGTLRTWDPDRGEATRVIFRTPLTSLDVHEGARMVVIGGLHGATVLRLRPGSSEETNDR